MSFGKIKNCEKSELKLVRTRPFCWAKGATPELIGAKEYNSDIEVHLY
jgi:hypothetical protein